MSKSFHIWFVLDGFIQDIDGFIQDTDGFIQDIDGFIQDIELFLRNCLNIINTSCSLHSVVSRITRDCIFMSCSSLCNDFFGNKKENKRKTWLEP